MKATNDGGPAFPVATIFNPHSGEPANTGQYWDGNGMSLRDWFAGMALQGTVSSGEPEDVKHNAIVAYRNADAMLAERNKS